MRTKTIDGVEIHCLGPEENAKHKFIAAYRTRIEGREAKIPDANLLSAILVLKYGESIVVLGSDALKANWNKAVKNFRESKLPKAHVLKVPHHGALNAMAPHPNNYLDICSKSPRAKAVLFAGDSKHPHPDVHAKLRERTELFCLSNGLKGASTDRDPLRIGLPGARAVSAPTVCNPVISFELDNRGSVKVVAGSSCETCSAL